MEAGRDPDQNNYIGGSYYGKIAAARSKSNNYGKIAYRSTGREIGPWRQPAARHYNTSNPFCQ